jgi:hypothetical protein
MIWCQTVCEGDLFSFILDSGHISINILDDEGI